MPKYKYVLFDLDGTITNPKEGITKSVAYALKHFGIDVENLDDLCKFIGPPLTDSFEQFYGFSHEKAIEGVKKYREYFSINGLFENEKYEGIDKLFEELKKAEIHIALATSKPTVFAKQILDHFGLTRYFDFIAGSELDGTRVKKGDVIAYALENLKIKDKSSVIMVGDREHDVIGARENGIKCISVLYGFGSLEEHLNAKTDYLAETILDLKNILLK